MIAVIVLPHRIVGGVAGGCYIDGPRKNQIESFRGDAHGINIERHFAGVYNPLNAFISQPPVRILAYIQASVRRKGEAVIAFAQSLSVEERNACALQRAATRSSMTLTMRA